MYNQTEQCDLRASVTGNSAVTCLAFDRTAVEGSGVIFPLKNYIDNTQMHTGVQGGARVGLQLYGK